MLKRGMCLSSNQIFASRLLIKKGPKSELDAGLWWEERKNLERKPVFLTPSSLIT